ncbi:MAG TPA: hypothetical protein VKP30_33560 [Polyangiaceae bacterium]|nr:hypothetical protein [Polyangiaceae bacterium]
MSHPNSLSNSTLIRSLALASSAASLLLTAQVAWGQSTSDPGSAAPTTRSAPPTVDECLAAHREAQSLRKQFRLRESRELLSDCSHDACPGPVKRDCMRWIDDITMQMPSVVFRLDTGDGTPTNKVKVYADGQLLFESIPNRAVEMNPGTYRLRFELEGKPPVEQEISLGEGEKFKNVSVKFESTKKPETPGAGTPGAVGPAPLTPEPAVEHKRPIPIATYVLAGVGAAAAISFGVTAIWSESLRKELKNECAPNCEQEFIDRVRTRGYIADISLGVSVASFAAATVFYFTRPVVEMPVKLDVAFLPHGGFAGSVLKEF